MGAESAVAYEKAFFAFRLQLQVAIILHGICRNFLA
jgi:hypothetical protein